MHDLRQILKEYSSNYTGDGPTRGAGVGGDTQVLSLHYSNCGITDGLPVSRRYVCACHECVRVRARPLFRPLYVRAPRVSELRFSQKLVCTFTLVGAAFGSGPYRSARLPAPPQSTN